MCHGISRSKPEIATNDQTLTPSPGYSYRLGSGQLPPRKKWLAQECLEFFSALFARDVKNSRVNEILPWSSPQRLEKRKEMYVGYKKHALKICGERERERDNGENLRGFGDKNRNQWRLRGDDPSVVIEFCSSFWNSTISFFDCLKTIHIIDSKSPMGLSAGIHVSCKTR